MKIDICENNEKAWLIWRDGNEIQLYEKLTR